MANTSKGIAPDRLTGIFGSQYIAATDHKRTGRVVLKKA